MSFNIRNKEGALIAQVDNMTASKIIRGARGHWVERNFTVGTKQMVFEVDEGIGYSVENKGHKEPFHIQIMLWKGTYIEMEGIL